MSKQFSWRGQRGFSLIEIMVVVIIIGLLASIVAPAVLNRADDARIQKVHAAFRNIQTALKLYRIDNVVYPSSEQGLDALAAPPTIAPVPRNRRQGGDLEELPRHPRANEYQYLSPGGPRERDTYSLVADGVAGGDGQNADISVWDAAVQDD